MGSGVHPTQVHTWKKALREGGRFLDVGECSKLYSERHDLCLGQSLLMRRAQGGNHEDNGP